MEETPEKGKESLHSACANGMTERMNYFVVLGKFSSTSTTKTTFH
jgi:hypothetical protein